MKIAIGSDQAGYLRQEEVKQHLVELGHDVIDVGTYSLDSCDYPIFGLECAKQVASKEADYGILVCSSGEKRWKKNIVYLCQFITSKNRNGLIKV